MMSYEKILKKILKYQPKWGKKQKALGRTSRLLSFGTTRTA
jgi:hypothetical protein